MNCVARLTGFSLLAALLSSAAQATQYEWMGGAFSKSGVPNPLVMPDTVLMHNPLDAPQVRRQLRQHEHLLVPPQQSRLGQRRHGD
jgi:hypothetical protein